MMSERRIGPGGGELSSTPSLSQRWRIRDSSVRSDGHNSIVTSIAGDFGAKGGAKEGKKRRRRLPATII